jgi:PAS domain-containing protein
MHLVGRFYRNILETIPLPVFLVDEELHVYKLNQAATELYWLSPDALLKKNGSDILQCLHSAEDSVGCGRSTHCTDCVIRKSTLECIERQTVRRQHVKFEAFVAGARREMRVTVTAAPMAAEDGNVVLMILEDITEVTLLKDLIPICMHCKKIRDDQQYWQRVESYFNRYIGVNFSHGVCPECEKEYYKDTA